MTWAKVDHIIDEMKKPTVVNEYNEEHFTFKDETLYHIMRIKYTYTYMIINKCLLGIIV